MNYQILLVPGLNYFQVKLSGKFNLENLENCYKEIINNPSWKPGFDILWDSSECDLTSLDLKAMPLIADMVNKYKEQRGQGRAAWLVKRKVDYGISRMFQGATNDDVIFNFRVFETKSEAEAWLLSSDSE